MVCGKGVSVQRDPPSLREPVQETSETKGGFVNLSKKDYRKILTATINRETGGQFDWSGITDTDWKRWYSESMWSREIVEERRKRVFPETIRQPPDPPHRSHDPAPWIVTGVLLICVAAITVVSAVLNTDGNGREDWRDLLE